MDKKHDLTKVSKFLSFILRHKPETIQLSLDQYGWASVTELINKAQSQITLTPEIIKQAVVTNDKKRFALSKNEKFIRANQGHSVKIDIALKTKQPPDILYHGTATRFLEAIKQEGLKPGERHHVHLSTDVNTSISVGKRYGKPVVLNIDTKLMFQEGYKFFLSENNVWLTKYVDPKLEKFRLNLTHQ